MNAILRILTCVTVLTFICNSFVFGGQMRTYVGTNDTIEEEQTLSDTGEVNKITPPESVPPIDPKEEKETAVPGNQQDRIGHTPPMISESPMPLNPIENTTENNEVQQVPEKIPEDQVKTISHDHIKSGGGYHMVGEPDNK